MRRQRRIRMALCLITAAIWMLGTALAGEAALEEKSLEQAGSFLSYPAVTGMEDEALEKQVNERIREDLRVTFLLQRMAALLSDDSRTLIARASGILAGEVYSAAMEAEGAGESFRDAHMWTWSNVDLRDGREIAFGELFTEETAARDALERYLEEQVAPEMSAHLENSELTPLPEGFRLEASGITLLYPAEQLSTLSSRAGAVKIGWNEIRAWADWSEDGIPARIGAAEMVNLTGDSAERIRRAAEEGRLPDIPVTLGDSVAELVERYHLLTDPDEYADGRMFSPEGAAFRNVYILTDALGAGWEESRVQGIRMDRGCVWGLCVGETEQAAWRQVLGEPDSSVAFDAERAEAYRLPPGNCDYYEYGGCLLQLYSDENGLLVSIMLTR